MAIILKFPARKPRKIPSGLADKLTELRDTLVEVYGRDPREPNVYKCPDCVKLHAEMESKQ